MELTYNKTYPVNRRSNINSFRSCKAHNPKRIRLVICSVFSAFSVKDMLKENSEIAKSEFQNNVSERIRRFETRLAARRRLLFMERTKTRELLIAKRQREKVIRPTRWSPTPEQLMFLEDMYRKGLRNPNATQIQSITAHLSSFGKIEGKNVFYWFQNHKARDRQKLKKKLLAQMNHQQVLAQYPIDAHSTTTTSNSNNTNIISLFHCPNDQYQICPFTSTGLLQEGGIKDASSQVMTDLYPMDLSRPPNDQSMENCMIRPYGKDWIVMMNINPNNFKFLSGWSNDFPVQISPPPKKKEKTFSCKINIPYEAEGTSVKQDNHERMNQ
ncbi:hypothetical protein RND71_009877 [Anisodus tanguticus]|uniref:Homeobox domain-containing protein n=1 Tax=Anisodus tanguticus TaxID=243964 RepID=A0AAE1VIK9_9SOLA|nr:hypothetical protein RND71_009877 [Anisodus tanguticus]